MFKEKIRNREAGIITYGITPPRKSNTPEKLLEITQRHLERIRSIAIDALVLYDIQDESARKSDRPFPYIETVDPAEYSDQYLQNLGVPQIIYRCVGKYSPEALSAWIKKAEAEERCTVFVGASSSRQQTSMSLQSAYDLVKGSRELLLGGVTLPERHITKRDEHLRVVDKCARGCSFFISQVTYNVQAAKDFLSDYYYYCRDHQLDMAPVLFTLTPCGSLQTLEFMKWLGVSLPRWLENDLLHSEDILEKSLSLSREVFSDILAYAREREIPIGCNIESVSLKKVEIDAAIRLLNDIRELLGK